MWGLFVSEVDLCFGGAQQTVGFIGVSEGKYTRSLMETEGLSNPNERFTERNKETALCADEEGGGRADIMRGTGGKR